MLNLLDLRKMIGDLYEIYQPQPRACEPVSGSLPARLAEVQIYNLGQPRPSMFKYIENLVETPLGALMAKMSITSIATSRLAIGRIRVNQLAMMSRCGPARLTDDTVRF